MTDGVRTARAWFFVTLLFGALCCAYGLELDTIETRTYLTDGWRIKHGDDPVFALPRYDDSSWERISLPASAVPLSSEADRVTWLRFTFTVDRSLEGQAVGIFLNKLPDAAELYVNGSLVGTSGTMPEHGYYGIDTIPSAFLIPQAVISYGGENTIALRIYSERRTGDLKPIFLTNNEDRLRTYRFEYFFNPLLGMISTLISIFAALYFFIMYVREPAERFNLYLVIGSVGFGLYYTSLFAESSPLSFLATFKLQMAGLHLGVLFYAFYFQDFFRFHSRRAVKIVLGSVVAAGVLALLFAADLSTTVFVNSTILYICVTVPLLFYMFFIGIVQRIKRRSYSMLLLAGVTVVIATGVHDMIYAVSGLQPRFWLNGWGMLAFLIVIFITNANRFMDIKLASQRESAALAEKTRVQMILLEDIAAIGRKIADSGNLLASAIEEAGTATNQVATSNVSIEQKIRGHLEEVESNNETISGVLNSLEEISHFVDEQAALVEQSSSAVTELAASISRVSETTRKAKEITGELTVEAGNGRKTVESASVAINEINESAEEVKQIVGAIGSIAATINLLGMNAAIEAAHAGAAGRGFAVVANEIRKLAEETGSSSKLIMERIETMAVRTTRGLGQFKEVREELDRILEGVARTDDLIAHITQAAVEQDAGAHELLGSVQAMLSATENVKQRSQRQRQDTERIRQATRDISTIFTDVIVSTEELARGGSRIAEVIENIRAVSDEHRTIRLRLEELLAAYT